MVVEIPVTQARAELAELVNRVVYAGERVVLTRHGRPVAAIVSAADLDQLSDTATAQGSRRIDDSDRRSPTEMRPPLRIAAHDQPRVTPNPRDDRSTSPRL